MRLPNILGASGRRLLYIVSYSCQNTLAQHLFECSRLCRNIAIAAKDGPRDIGLFLNSADA